jgi:2-oxoglutarate/2-oxoacid ferredoxin oxidoreductase subunit alpha
MERLSRKFETAKRLVPAPLLEPAEEPTPYGVIHYGSTAPAMSEALDALKARGCHLDAMRLRAFPFVADVADFIARHDTIFVVEQNRDAQARSLLTAELGIDPAKLVPILHYDGTPITARFIAEAIGGRLAAAAPAREAAE